MSYIEKKFGDIKIRVASPSDAEALLKIYAPYITDTAITFEYVVPTKEEFAKRIQHVLEKYPYLVAEQDGHIVGYAYASQFHVRAAFAWCVETSIYVDKEKRANGIGNLLYSELEDILKRMGIINVNASIAYPEVEDEYLTKASEKFHQHFGFTTCAKFTNCGYKFHR